MLHATRSVAHYTCEDGPLVRRCVLIALLVTVSGASAAQAITQGSTALLDRPSGSGALPFDGMQLQRLRTLADSRRALRRLLIGLQRAAARDEDRRPTSIGSTSSSGQVVQVDTTAAGGQPTAGARSCSPSISADGNHVGFFDRFAGARRGGGPAALQFVVKNLTTGGIELASRANGAQGRRPPPGFAVLSGDGRHVAFTAAPRSRPTTRPASSAKWTPTCARSTPRRPTWRA